VKADIGANDEGIGVILHLVDQLHGVRRALAELRRQMEKG
jgi:chaperone modulatory protein CbpM